MKQEWFEYNCEKCSNVEFEVCILSNSNQIELECIKCDTTHKITIPMTTEELE